ncbi:threonine aldolase family protein [Sandaracinobacteroides saxicola]|uniref:Low specificity L-threonine aldolase n=1 Tax=Sandaracinobacteroides saxicola TaxID=2759707 RepID=A0A7G5IGU1_9SPHN|nr:beta-eliminating lyase-related protein [Sandaracinobacteroides saxicola]QMW22583.1 low specificity L-threonine aldolase [Sandaracinobacteroides saxicola]
MDFYSDNAAGVHPAVLAAVTGAAGPHAKGYDADDWTARLDAAFGALFETPCRVFAVPSGTAANALGLAAMLPPWGALWCEREAHVEVDEAGAVPFYSGGATHLLVAGAHGKLSVEALSEAAGRRRGDVHQTQAAALSLTQATEAGTVYAPDEIAALSAWARARGCRVHMDGARFANAVAHLGCAPADVTWRAGVEILSFGCIKNGGMSAEALVVFAPDLAASIPHRRKRAGLMPSKGRFAAAQLLAMIDGGVWLANARAANAGAAAIAAAVPQRLLHPVQANEVFLRLDADERQALRRQGFGFYEWESDGPGAARLVVRWDADSHAIAALVAALRAL